MRKTISIISSVFLLVLIFSCGGKKEETIPSEILPEGKMVQIFTDMQLAEASIQVNNLGLTDSSRNIAYGYYRFIFEKYKVSQKDFKNSFDYYTSHPDKMNAIYKSVIAELGKRQAQKKSK